MPDRAHHPAVELAQALLGDGRQRMAVRFVPALADGQGSPLDEKALARGGRLHHLDAFRNHFEPDVVAEQDADLQPNSSPHSKPLKFDLLPRERLASMAVSGLIERFPQGDRHDKTFRPAARRRRRNV